MCCDMHVLILTHIHAFLQTQAQHTATSQKVNKKDTEIIFKDSTEKTRWAAVSRIKWKRDVQWDTERASIYF